MGRYSLNLRGKYGRDETTGGERIQKGIGTAIDDYLKMQTEERTEANTMAAAGATRLPDAPRMGVMDRLRGAAGAARGVFDRGARPTQPFNPAGPVALGGGNPMATAPVPFVERTPPRPLGNGPLETPIVPQASATRPTIATALDEDQSYVHQGVHGAKYRVDPQRGERQKRALQNETDDRDIADAIAAGMDPNEARVRVRQKLMRYDDVYGPQRGGGSATGAGPMGAAEWTRRANQRQAERIQMEKLKNEGKMTEQEFTRRRLKHQDEAAADRREQAAERAGREETKADISLGNAIDRGIVTDPIALATMTEAQKADNARRIRERDNRLRTAGTSADRQKAQRRARTLQNQGKSRQEIADILTREGIKVTP